MVPKNGLSYAIGCWHTDRQDSPVTLWAEGSCMESKWPISQSHCCVGQLWGDNEIPGWARTSTPSFEAPMQKSGQESHDTRELGEGTIRWVRVAKNGRGVPQVLCVIAGANYWSRLCQSMYCYNVNWNRNCQRCKRSQLIKRQRLKWFPSENNS